MSPNPRTRANLDIQPYSQHTHFQDLNLEDLGDLGPHLARLQHCLGPYPQLDPAVMIIFCGDHGLSHIPGLSAYPREVTVQMCHNYMGGGAGTNVLGIQNGFDMIFVDSGVDWDSTPPGMLNRSMGRGTASSLDQKAMTLEQAQRCIDLGRTLVQDLIQKGYHCMAMGEMGISNTCASALIYANALSMDVALLCGRGSGVKDLDFKTQILQQIQSKHGLGLSPMEALATYAGFEMAQMVGAFVECGLQQIPVLVDGYIASACFCLAVELEPRLKDCAFLCTRSAELGQSKALEHLGMGTPILNLGLRLGEGTGAAVAKPILDSLCLILQESK